MIKEEILEVAEKLAGDTNYKIGSMIEIPRMCITAEQIAPHHAAHYGGALRGYSGIDAKLEESIKEGTAIDANAYIHMFGIYPEYEPDTKH